MVRVGDIVSRSATRASLGCILIVGGLFWPSASLPFGTINQLGQSAEHEKITRLALAGAGFQPFTLDMLAGSTGSFGAVGAPDRPDRGLMSDKAAHCDGGDHLDVPAYPHDLADAQARLEECRKWIYDNLGTAVVAASALVRGGKVDDTQIPTHLPCIFNGSTGRAKCNVLEALGLAFHAAQDFYAHTNWADTALDQPIGLENPPGLQQPEPAGWIDPRRQDPFPQGLISGCYDGFPETIHCADRVRHKVLNKDEGPINPQTGLIGTGTTTRGAAQGNFASAVTAAIADTSDKWQYFRESVLANYGPQNGELIICAVLHDDPAKTCR